MHVAVIYSLPSKRMLATSYGVTDEDSAIIANKVVLGLQANGMQVTLHGINEDRIEAIAEISADCIFNLIEWCGLDIALSQRAFGYMRALKIPVTGSSEELFVLTGDKIALKQTLQRANIATPNALSFTTGDEPIAKRLNYPVIVKPSLEHCSTGLSYDSIAASEAEMRRIAQRQIATFHQSALAEEFIVGREFLVYLIEEQNKVRVLPIEEVIFTGDHDMPFQTYEAKWDASSPEYNTTDVVVAKITSNEQSAIESESIKAFKKLGLRGYARFDVRLKDGVPYMLETNANPSVYDTDDETLGVNDEVIWGITFPDYLLKIVESALYHYERGEIV